MREPLRPPTFPQLPGPWVEARVHAVGAQCARCMKSLFSHRCWCPSANTVGAVRAGVQPGVGGGRDRLTPKAARCHGLPRTTSFLAVFSPYRSPELLRLGRVAPNKP